MVQDRDPSTEIVALQAALNEREQALAKLKAEVDELKAKNRDLEQKARANGDSDQPTAITEFEETLRRLVHRIAMILQAEKCVFMLLDRESGELYAVAPAFGMTDEHIKQFRVRATQGISGEVFRTSQSLIFHDAASDERTIPEHVALMGIQNGCTSPLVIEKRDDENRVTDRITIGVVHVFNKRYGQEFIQEDVQLLERLAKNAAAVLASAQMYREVVEEKEELISTIDSLSAGLVMVNRRGRVTLVNTSAQHIFSATEEAAEGKNYTEFITIEPVRELFTKALESQEEGAAEVSVMDEEAGIERIFQVQVALVTDDDNEVIGAVAIFNDITEIRNIERMKTAFVSTVSHELRTPLTSIKGFVSTLLADTDGYYDNDTRLEFLGIIDAETDRLRRLIEDLLNVSRIEAGRALQLNPKPIDVPGLAEKVCTIQRSYTHKHTLSTHFTEDFPTIVADEDKVDQILTNLVNNAIKYSPDGGQVKVRGWYEPEVEQVVVGVSDQGIGIPKDQAAKVFERFHRVDNRDTREVGGTGIGLFLVKHLVEVHGGEIWVESEPGQGSEFLFRLPLKPPETAEDAG